MKVETIARALGGHKVGRNWMAPCPAHDDRNPSLSIRDADGKVLVHCHARCDQRDVIDALRVIGLWAAERHDRRSKRHRQAFAVEQPDNRGAEQCVHALSIWDASVPAPRTLAETYLASRGLDLPQSSALRFHRGLKHCSGGIWPCMVALVTRGDAAEPVAIHRTFLARDGAGKAPVDPAKIMLGPCRGGAVRLAEPADVLMVGEGVETCVAAMQATGLPTWAALSTSGLRALELPVGVLDVIVLADGDDAGEAAAVDCARRLQRDGRRVRIARPPRGMDFNDVLLGCVSPIKGSTK